MSEVIGDLDEAGEVRIIGVEFRVRDPRTGREYEVFVHPLDAIVRPAPLPEWERDQHRLTTRAVPVDCSVTVHTSHGDINGRMFQAFGLPVPKAQP